MSLTNIPNSDFYLEIVRNNKPGYSRIDKFGRTKSLASTATNEDVWNGGGVYTGFPTTGSAETLEIVRANTGDVGDIQLLGLDRDYNEITETVSLSGVGTHTTTQTFWRMARAIWKGSATLAGDITVRHSTTTANIFAVMPADVNQTAIACVTIPAGFTGYLKSLHIEMARTNGLAGSAEVGFKIRETDGVAFQTFRNLRPTQITNSKGYSLNLASYLELPEKTDVKVTANSVSDNNTKVSADFDIILVKN